MERTSSSFTVAATKVQVSRKLGRLLHTRKGTTQMDTRTAISGFMETMVSMNNRSKRF